MEKISEYWKSSVNGEGENLSLVGISIILQSISSFMVK